MSKKLIITIATSICLLSGCAVRLASSPEDYQGSDFSRIRAKNYAYPLTMNIYEKDGDCYKHTDTKSLGPGFNIFGIKSTYNKKIPGMLPASKEMQGLDALEYKIKANQRIELEYKAVTFRSQYTQTITTYRHRFIPKEGHDYDLYDNNLGIINIFDLTTNSFVNNGWGSDKECKGKVSYWTGKMNYD
ncbi:hypothetical protein [Proteus faecis]|uniref:hypothetical protein n=1 Tax=Proteus faecis TaxID=2050967 RepID=UPI003075BDD6